MFWKKKTETVVPLLVISAVAECRTWPFYGRPQHIGKYAVHEHSMSREERLAHYKAHYAKVKSEIARLQTAVRVLERDKLTLETCYPEVIHG